MPVGPFSIVRAIVERARRVEPIRETRARWKVETRGFDAGFFAGLRDRSTDREVGL